MKIVNGRIIRALVLALCLLLPGCFSPEPVYQPIVECGPEPLSGLKLRPRAEPSYTLAFSPQGESLELVLSCIESAEQSIQVAAYSFTSKPVALALTEAHRRGVAVQVVADKKGNSSRYTAVTYLANHGVPVRLNGRYTIHHHKFMVIDGRHVQTGSFNYSAAAANKNAENVLVLRDAPELAALYAAEWQRLWDEAKPLAAKY